MQANSNRFNAILLMFFTTTAGTILSIYSSTLFLSSYPRSWLPAFLITQALANTLISILIVPLLIKNIKANSITLLLISILTMIVIIFALWHAYFWTPFICANIVSMISIMLALLGWNIIPLGFGIRDYKLILISVNKVSNIAGIGGCLAVAMLLHFFSLSSILIVTIFLLTGTIFATSNMILENVPAKHKKEASPIKYPLYRAFLIFFAMVLMSQTLTDYVFKYEVAKHFKKEEIGIFLGYFGFVLNILSFGVSLALSKSFLRIFKINGLMYITPFFTAILAGCAILYPSLWTIAALASTRILFFYNHTRLAMEMILNILPSAVRISSKTQIKSFVTPVLTVTVFLLLLLFYKWLPTRATIAVILVLSIVAIYLIKRVNYFYKKTLQQETEFRRFNIINNLNPNDLETVTEMVRFSFSSTDVDIILFGLDETIKMNIKTLPNEFYNLISHPNETIRENAINIVKQNKLTFALPYLINQLDQEKDLALRLEILDTISLLDIKSASAIALPIIANPNDTLFVAALGVYLQSNKKDEHAFAIQHLQQHVKDKIPAIRRVAAILIGRYNLIELLPELKNLIHDDVYSVSETAMQIVGENRFTTLIPDLIEELGPSQRGYAAKQALIKMGDIAVNELIKHTDNIFVMRVIAGIPGERSEQALLDLSHEGNIYYKTILAKEVDYHAYHFIVSNKFKEQAKAIALNETKYHTYLYQLAESTSDISIKNEIALRLLLAKRRALYWTAVSTNAFKLSQVLPSLLTSEESSANQQARGKALELLEIYITDVDLKKSVLALFEKDEILQPLQIYDDEWLDALIKKEMNTKVNKVIQLHNFSLFKNIPSEILLAIADDMKEYHFVKGDCIFKEGDEPDGLYCIIQGEVNIVRNNKVLSTLTTCNYFGELALMDESKRAATVIVTQDVTVLYLSRDNFDHIILHFPEVLKEAVKVIAKYVRQSLI